MTIFSDSKRAIRRLIPAALQVPIKYWYEWFRGYIEPEMALLPLLLSREDQALDVGANRGAYAYRLAKLCSHVQLFEPNPACAGVLEAWAAGTGGRVKVNRVALSDGAGEAVLHIPLDAAGVEHDASASLNAGLQTDEHLHRDISVPLARLDDFEFAPVALIKIDVEGHEGSVLRGATSTIAKWSPALIIEIEARHLDQRPITEVFDLVTSQGYRGYFVRAGKLEPISAFDVGRDQPWPHSPETHYHNNFLFLSEGKIQEGRYARLPWGTGTP